MTSQERRRRGDEEEDGDVGKEVRFGESEGGGQKGNSGGGGDGGSDDEDDDGECKYGKGDTDEEAVDSFVGNNSQGYSHRDPENHQNKFSRLNEEIVLSSKLETELFDTRKELTKARKREVETRYFSDGLPKRLVDVEKASQPLNNFLKVSDRRRMKYATAATTDGSVANVPSVQPLIGTKQSEYISAVLNFPEDWYYPTRK